MSNILKFGSCTYNYVKLNGLRGLYMSVYIYNVHVCVFYNNNKEEIKNWGVS